MLRAITPPALHPPFARYSHAVEVQAGARLLFCSGQLGIGADAAVPESAEWKKQQEHSSPNSPRMRQAMTHAPGSPGVYARVSP